MEAYGLDGIFWDDENTAATSTIPGFITGSTANASRLIFEFRRAMPDKLNIVYAYERLKILQPVDGIDSGLYVDYVMADYGETLNHANWPGSTPKQMMSNPYEMARLGEFPKYEGSPQTVKSNNHGGIMVFAMSEHRDNWETQLGHLKYITTTLFNDELVYSGVSYPLEW